jgi:hypothetical protein
VVDYPIRQLFDWTSRSPPAPSWIGEDASVLLVMFMNRSAFAKGIRGGDR